MAPHVVPLRGLGDLRTRTGRSEAQIPLHKAYLRISFLELERARHGQEMRTAQQRLQLMLNRCRQIDAEKAEILAAASPVPPAPGPPPTLRGEPPRRRGFRFSY
jgi:hypothetical protein